MSLIEIRHLRKEYPEVTPLQDVTVTVLDDGHFHIDFDVPQRAITAGQAVVFYDGDIVVGGGCIL